MEGWRLTEQDLRGWLDGILKSGKRLVAPVEEGGLVLFRPVSSQAEITLADYGNTRWSPKEFIFPRTEPLFSYRWAGGSVKLASAPSEEKEQVLFGLRPCDAAGLCRLDDIFLGAGEDRLYAGRRRRTTVISLACVRARAECFCTAVGGSPAGAEGVDVQVVALAGAWLVTALTPKGEEIAALAEAGWTRATAKDRKEAEAQRVAVEQSIRPSRLLKEWGPILEKAFESPAWESFGARCLGCGICAYVCPSCSCFDINDEGSAFCGSRCRSWDSCTLARFTLHASGHNPRPTHSSRYRHRLLHKFSYFPREHGERFMCVGCGRCLRLCPVGIDIRESLERIVRAEAARGEIHGRIE